MMDRFFTFLQTYRSGIVFLLVCLASIAFLVQWFAWIFGKGRFSRAGPGTVTGTGTGTSRAALRYIFSEATVKIINDFRHLLALVIVLIFAFALGFSLIKAAFIPSTGTPSVIDNMKEALQAVVATLGGLVGSIIGYYFGESSVVKAAEPRSPTPAPDAEPIVPVKAPSHGDGTPADQ
jgi:hypothetical protein